MNDSDLDRLLADTLDRHAAETVPMPGDPAARVRSRAARRGRLVVAAIAAPVAVAAAVAAFTLLGPSHSNVVPATPATRTPTPTGAASAGRPALDRQVPAAALTRLSAAVHQLTQSTPGRPAALRARLVHYQVDSWRSEDNFTLLVTLDLHFPPLTSGAWNQGANSRFVRFSRQPPSGTYRLDWATSP